ncbi:VCBS domain-containing protein, partial [Microbacterium sp. P5_E9]
MELHRQQQPGGDPATGRRPVAHRQLHRGVLRRHGHPAGDNSQAAIQQLGAGQSLTDSFIAVSYDGTATQLVTVTIT